MNLTVKEHFSVLQYLRENGESSLSMLTDKYGIEILWQLHNAELIEVSPVKFWDDVDMTMRVDLTPFGIGVFRWRTLQSMLNTVAKL